MMNDESEDELDGADPNLDALSLHDEDDQPANEHAADPLPVPVAGDGEYLIVIWEVAYRYQDNIVSSCIIQSLRYHPHLRNNGLTSLASLAKSVRDGLRAIFQNQLGFIPLNSGSAYGNLPDNQNVAAIRDQIRDVVQEILNPPAPAVPRSIDVRRAAYWLNWLFDWESVPTNPQQFMSGNRNDVSPLVFVVGNRLALPAPGP